MSEDNAGVKFPPPLIYLFGILAGYLLQRVEPLSILSPGQELLRRALGWIGVLGFAALAVSALGLFRRAGTSFHPRRPSTALVESGPYRFTRNPMYLGFASLMIGAAFLINSWWVLLMAVVAVLIVDRTVIQPEEAYLERKFGDEYRQYKTRVRRWL